MLTSGACKSTKSSYAYLELARLFELVHVALTFERTTRSEEDVFVVAVDVLNPSREPSNGVIMEDILPLAANIGHGYGRILANVDRDIFRPYAQLQ